MTGPTNDIDALLRCLISNSLLGWHAALTALVAERDALATCVQDQDAQLKALAASHAIMHGRLEDADAIIAAMRKGVQDGK